MMRHVLVVPLVEELMILFGAFSFEFAFVMLFVLLHPGISLVPVATAALNFFVVQFFREP